MCQAETGSGIGDDAIFAQIAVISQRIETMLGDTPVYSKEPWPFRAGYRPPIPFDPEQQLAL